MQRIYQEVENSGFKISTDTRTDVSGSVYFALKGETFDGNEFVHNAIEKGALAAISSDPTINLKNVYIVEDVLKTLQEIAKIYRKTFDIPIIAIGGSNGKTTSKELLREVLETKYKVHATKENLNNHIGVPLSILSMSKDTEIGIFEIGANHPNEHTRLLEILEPDIVAITNNGLDHLEGFISPMGVRNANKEIYDWALGNSRIAFVNEKASDLMEDSKGLQRVLYPEHSLKITNSIPLTIKFGNEEYRTKLVGDYNLINIQFALSLGKHFEVRPETGLRAITEYHPSSKRSELIIIGDNNFIIDCYNANPSSMMLSLESFIKGSKRPCGAILGDMLELGGYSDEEHRKVLSYLAIQELDLIVFIGNSFKKALGDNPYKKYFWFPTSDDAREWFSKQHFEKCTFLLKGSRGIKVEKILGL